MEIEEKESEVSGRLSNVFENRQYLMEEDEAEFYDMNWQGKG